MEVNTGLGGLGNEETERDPLFGSPQAENSLFELRLVYADMRKSLMRFVARYLKKAPHDAEDIIQEVFVKAIEAQNKREIRFPKAYLYKVAKNLALKKLEKSEYRLTDTLGDLLFETLVSQVPSMDQQLEYREKFAVFCRAVGKLPERRRRAFVLRRVYGLSQKEIADEMNISLKTVEAHLTKAIKVTAEAANWIVRLDRGALSADELDALREWVSRSRRHRECLVKMAGDWDSMAILEGLADIFPLADFSSERRQEKKSCGDGLPGGPSRPGVGFRAGLAWFGAAAAVASAVVAAALFALNAPLPAEYETAAGEQACHILEGGSVIALNTGSRVSVDYDGARRSVTLFAGYQRAR